MRSTIWEGFDVFLVFCVLLLIPCLGLHIQSSLLAEPFFLLNHHSSWVQGSGEIVGLRPCSLLWTWYWGLQFYPQSSFATLLPSSGMNTIHKYQHLFTLPLPSDVIPPLPSCCPTWGKLWLTRSQGQEISKHWMWNREICGVGRNNSNSTPEDPVEGPCSSWTKIRRS